MSRLVAETGECIQVQIPTRSHSNAAIRVFDEDGNILLFITVASYPVDGLTTRVIVEGQHALLLQDASSIQLENSRVVFERKQA